MIKLACFCINDGVWGKTPRATLLPKSQWQIKIKKRISYTKFKKQLNQKTQLSTTQIFNKTILT
jgi:hypothetical protein